MDLNILKCQKKVKKKSEAKFKIEKKNDKSNTISVQFWREKNGEVASDLKNLSKSIGALFWCDSNAKIQLRS